MIASETATLSGVIIISLLKGLAIGLVFGAPVGVAGIMSMQRTLFAGPAAGFMLDWSQLLFD